MSENAYQLHQNSFHITISMSHLKCAKTYYLNKCGLTIIVGWNITNTSLWIHRVIGVKGHPPPYTLPSSLKEVTQQLYVSTL